MKNHVAIVSAVMSLGALGPSVAAEGPAGASLELEPVVTAPDRAEMRVTERLPHAVLGSGSDLRLAFATMAPSYQRTTDTVTGLTAEDAAGPLPLAGPSRDGSDDVWRSTRPVRGDVTLRYAVPAAPHDIPHRGPITYLQHSGGGLSGSFASFLLAPRSDAAVDVAVRWRLPAGQQAVSNAGIDDFTRRTTFADLAETMFVAGPLVHSPAALPDDALVVAALGSPQQDVDRAWRWYAKAFPVMRSAFDAGTVRAYRIMVFSHDRQAFNSGTSRAGGFLFFIPQGQHLDDRRNHRIIAHEMVHSFAASYDRGADGPSDWYDEGIADYASITVPRAAGLYTAREYLDYVNEEAAAYYLNPLRSTPNDRLAAIKWTRKGAWSLGYDRGALYFGNLDARLAARGARTTVLGLIRRMNALATTRAIGPADWEALLHRQAGAEAVSDWRAMLSGRVIRPVPGAFGRCLVARRIVAGHHELGFTPRSTPQGDRADHVVPGSNAYKAGLRDGDLLAQPFVAPGPDDGYDGRVTLTLRGPGGTRTIAYALRAGQEEAYRWFPRSGDPDHPCASRRTPT